MPNGIMDGFFSKVNQRLTSDDTESPLTHPSIHCYFIGRIFEKPVQKV